MNDPANPTNVISQTPRQSRIRWPLRLQLLLPMVAVVLLASFLATAITAYWIALRVRNEQKENLRRVAKTLAEVTFPLTERVLTQISGLSGAEFILIGPAGRLQQATLPTEQSWLETLSRIADSHPEKDEKPIVSLGGRDYLVQSVTVSNRPKYTETGTLFILYPEDQLASRIRQAIYPALIAGIVAAIVALAITTWLARGFARPIHKLVQQTAAIARGNFTPMPVPSRNDELCDLIESINSMTGQLADYEQQVRRNERLKTLDQLGAALAHQLRNAATGGTMAIELHRRDCPNALADESLEVALRQLRLMESYLRQFLSIQRPAPDVQVQVDANALTTDVLSLLRPSCCHAGVELQFNPPLAPLFLQGDPESLRQLVTNLVLNALEAAVSHGAKPPRVLVEVGPARNGFGALTVQDTGPGPAESIRDQLFDSFVTTKPNGVGLGLFVARQIAQRHGGRLSWQRRDNLTSFIFEFPLSPIPHPPSPNHATRTDC
jgi:signal transduction histidine kinase